MAHRTYTHYPSVCHNLGHHDSQEDFANFQRIFFFCTLCYLKGRHIACVMTSDDLRQETSLVKWILDQRTSHGAS